MTSNREFQSSGLNYIHVDVANHFAMGSVDEFLTSRKCSDAVLVFQSDEDFGRTCTTCSTARERRSTASRLGAEEGEALSAAWR